MEFIDSDKRHTLRVHLSPRLIQSGRFVKPFYEKKEITKFSDIIRLNYMSSFEFQMNLQAYSLRRIILNSDFYQLYEISEYQNSNGESLKVYAPEKHYPYIRKIIDRLAHNGKVYDEFCTLQLHLGDMEEKVFDETDFWWDLDGDYFFFFEHADRILKFIENSNKERKGYRSGNPRTAIPDNHPNYYNRLYKCYITKYLAIENYFFDYKEKKHYIEFRIGQKLERIFRDAMLIAKVDGGKVVFEVNGFHYEIDEKTRLDDLIFGYVVDIDEECVTSTSIEDLKMRKAYERSLIRVLKSAYNKREER